MSRLNIVIPVHDGWAALGKCLEALANSRYQDFSVTIVDHGPESVGRPDTLPFADRLTAQTITASPELWWTGATNVGIRAALENRDPQYIMLLNHDCYVASNAITILMKYAESNTDTLVAPVQVDAASHRVLARKAYTLYTLGFPTVVPPVSFFADPSKPLVSTGMIIGGRGVVIPKRVFDSIGLLDEEHLPHYGSDNDFYLRSKAAGFRLSVATDARVYVDNSQTTEASGIARLSLPRFFRTLTNRRSHRNIHDQVQLFKKHYPIPGLFILGVTLNIARYAVIYLLARLIRSFSRLRQ